MATPAASRVLFSEAVREVLLSWPVLQIAVDNGFGGVYGTQKADWMVDVVQQFFHDNADLQRGEVEDFLSDIMNQEFNTVVEDGSLPQLCDALLQMFSQWQQGALQTLRNTIDSLSQKKSERAKVTPPPPQSDEDEDEEPQVMECEPSAPSVSRKADPPEEEEGWTVVKKK
ncbi:pre-rRNA-processing protein TSR2 homolog isoform X1 [Trematomus bernacchii]|uniref:pre-rRNA-processing protein TSR2 homolog isoform X1 n=2 Tax=Trematomus bernacchii TaxID=40690 RepID=UPI00146ACF5C|nr:pre-rRNA-processing protein TSR2 homolog isoform X1 [Trematomus bernacchii]